MGDSKVMQELRALIRVVAEQDATVVVEGETGTGKELVAQLIHPWSRRAKNKFVARNCGAIPSTLFESEFFGHCRGGFTNATANRKGIFEQAENGTLFLDEFGEVSLHLQPTFLRVFQNRQVDPVGSVQSVPFEARLIIATNRDLQQMVREGSFRADLYYRINVFKIVVPPLRERRNDIPLLANYFLAQFASENARVTPTLSPEALRIVMDCNWPGNIRQLQNAMKSASVYRRGLEPFTILPEHLPSEVLANTGLKPLGQPLVSLNEHQRDYLVRVLQRTNCDLLDAAGILEIRLSTLRRLLRKHNIDPEHPL